MKEQTVAYFNDALKNGQREAGMNDVMFLCIYDDNVYKILIPSAHRTQLVDHVSVPGRQAELYAKSS